MFNSRWFMIQGVISPVVIHRNATILQRPFTADELQRLTQAST
jgi:hypothetical protein